MHARSWLSAGLMLVTGVFTAVPQRAADAGPRVAFKQVREGKLVLSLPPHWASLDPKIAIWLHLHGAPGVLESNFAGIGAPGILINLTLPGLSKIYADYFADPRVFPELLNTVESVLRRESPGKPWAVGHVTVSSFSAGFGGVRQLLRQPAAFDRIDALVMADSIYCGYVGGPGAKRVEPELMAGFVRFAQLAHAGKRRLVISHSRQVPEGYASTTETADYLIRELGGARRMGPPAEWEGGLRWQSGYTHGGVEIHGFDGEAAEDHMRHLRAIGAFLKRARRTE